MFERFLFGFMIIQLPVVTDLKRDKSGHGAFSAPADAKFYIYEVFK